MGYTTSLLANQEVSPGSPVSSGFQDRPFKAYLVNDGGQGCIYHHDAIFQGFHYMVRSIHSGQLLLKVLREELCHDPEILKISPIATTNLKRFFFLPKTILIPKHYRKKEKSGAMHSEDKEILKTKSVLFPVEILS